MPDYISVRVLKRKALERWENEGGRIDGESGETLQETIPPDPTAAANAARLSADEKLFRKDTRIAD